jgi:DNA transposition AAA+ family ATPase
MARADVSRQLDTRALRNVRVSADRTHVEVVLAGEVHLTLLRLLAREPFVVEVRARAVPRRSS